MKMATTTPTTSGTPLSRHDCPCCGAPISLRQEAIGESLLRLASLTTEDMDLDGDCTPVYCVACLEVLLDAEAKKAELARLEAFIRGADAMLG